MESTQCRRVNTFLLDTFRSEQNQMDQLVEEGLINLNQVTAISLIKMNKGFIRF